MYFSTCRGWFIFNMSGIHSPQRLPPLTLTFCLTFRSCGCCLSFAVAFLLPAAHTHPPHASPQVRSDPWVEKGGAGHKGRVKEEGEEEEDDDDIVNIEVENDAVDPGVFQFESPIKIANPLGLCASSRDDDVDASPEIPRTDNVGFGTRKQPGTEKKQEEGCHIS